ncbi:MAG TPA: FAD/NAD(P)-binding protein [Pirellulales bacterium]|nr:FAD/NAD(P)-binding protein [Pirellulales bacterium]
MKTIVIIGGGFCGTMTAVNLARFRTGALRVVLVNHKFPLGRGVAYSTTQSEHLLNVAARNMSALADHPNHLLDWLRTRSEYADVPEATLRETFIPRKTYGDYLRSLLLWYSRPLDDSAEFQVDFIDGEAVDVQRQGERCIVLLADGQAIEADKVLLATGNQPPAELSVASPEVLQHPGYFASPWDGWQKQLRDNPQHGATADAIVLGTGLTMVDALLTLLAHDWQGRITAVSRHGWLPQSHFKGIEYPDFPPADVASMSLEQLVDLLEEHCDRLRKQGANPAIVVDKMRPHTQRIWQKFSVAEKREFCRRYAARWNVIRHRIAQQIHQRVAEAASSGKLHVVAGSIERLEADGPRLRVVVKDANGDTRALEAGVVVNCTGPCRSFSKVPVALFQNLLGSGLVQVDDLDMGLRVDTDFTAIDAAGNRSDLLYAMGPLLHGTLWETIAVPELRGQALRVAQTLLEACAAAEPGHELWPATAEAAVLEYCI